jgi:hypothetical protein
MNGCDRDHCTRSQERQNSRSVHAAFVLITVQAIQAGVKLMKMMRSSYKNRPYAPGHDRLVLKTEDCSIIAVLLLLMATAVLTAPRSATEAYQKLQALLLVDVAPELIATGGAIGEHFPVSP